MVCCASFVAALLISVFMMTSPASKNKNGWFSAERAWTHLENISKEQHSVFDSDAIEDVRNYIEETIDAFGHVQWARVKHRQIEVRNQKAGGKEWIDIDNIYAEIPGTSGRYMLLMAHYDSSPYKEKYGVGTEGSYGAADDGYGLATMLEIMRLLNDCAATGTLVNGVKFAFTDAEEVALGGAVALVKEFSYWLKDVNIVLNLEARGNKGPLYMFQTSDKNSKLIDFYSQTHLPFSFSIAADVYKHLPNDTDFTPFLKGGYAGLNFAVLNSLKYYHTPEDNLNNADMATLQFYGEQIYPLVREYIDNERYSAADSFVSNSNAVFFSLFPGLLAVYSEQFSWILSIIATLCTALLAFFAIRKRAISWKKAILALGLWTGYLLAATITGLLMSMCIGFVTGNKFNLMHMPYVPFDLGFVVVFAALVLAAGFWIAKLCRKFNCRFADTSGGAILLILILNVIFAFLLHGGTYLFLWPVVFLLAIFALHLFGPSGKAVQLILCALTVLIVTILYVTLVYSLFLALTFGALAIILLFSSFLGCILTPCVKCTSP